MSSFTSKNDVKKVLTTIFVGKCSIKNIVVKILPCSHMLETKSILCFIDCIKYNTPLSAYDPEKGLRENEKYVYRT